jgi:hypothetical protein
MYEDYMRGCVRLACYALCVSGAFIAPISVVNAQTPTSPPDAAAPKSNGDTDKKSGDVPLSKKLNENEGVLKPPTGVDPQMHQQPPANTGDKMPVIVPPGEPGGDQSVQPK